MDKEGKDELSISISENLNCVKITCIECHAELFWNPGIRKYIEGQLIKCIFCGISFNQVSCPQCKHLNVFRKGGFDFGNLIKCSNLECDYSFSQVFCPRCLHINISDENLEGKKIKCPTCHLNYKIVNCLYCRRINIWEAGGLLPGQIISCVYCTEKFNKILCPKCEVVIPFYKADFKYGKYYTCINEECVKEYKFVLCLSCNSVNFIFKNKIEIIENNLSIVQCGKCEKIIYNLPCPFCHKFIIKHSQINTENENDSEENIIVKNELIVPSKLICPYNDCHKIFFLTECFNCNQKYFSTDAFPFVENLCNKCHSNSEKNIITQSKRFLDVFKIKTLKRFDKFICGKPPCFINNTDDCLFGLQHSEGIPFFFDKPEAKLREIIQKGGSIKDIIVQEPKPKPEPEDDDKNKCVVCFEFDKEALFVPCGHKVCCVGCAKSMFKTIKNCCMCHETIERVIERIYE
jgi:hypothetical protein